MDDDASMAISITDIQPYRGVKARWRVAASLVIGAPLPSGLRLPVGVAHVTGQRDTTHNVQKRKEEKTGFRRERRPVSLAGFLAAAAAAAAFRVSRRATRDTDGHLHRRRSRRLPVTVSVSVSVSLQPRGCASALTWPRQIPTPPPISIRSRWALALGGGALYGRRPYTGPLREMTSDQQPVYTPVLSTCAAPVPTHSRKARNKQPRSSAALNH